MTKVGRSGWIFSFIASARPYPRGRGVLPVDAVEVEAAVAQILHRAALAVVRRIDHEASFYEAQSPVEDWALDALEAAVADDLVTAKSLLDRYEGAEWEERRAYAISDWDEACQAAVRAANAH